ncbi:MAG TPA: Crp/Fnr family transcriptional regulator [Blastocatellia bacterium]|nr:Crp/Fnr family transcriptional regulator [Blastocatellia bacterium]
MYLTHTLQNPIIPPPPDYNCGQFFRDLSEAALNDYETIVQTSFYPAGTMLFWEGQAPEGVYLLSSGRAKLSISSSNGRTLMRVVEPGEPLGLGATVSGRPYEGSAGMLNTGQVNFIGREDFLGFLGRHGEAGLQVARHLSLDYYHVHDQVRSLALSESVAEKLARLLLGWCARDGKETEHGIRLKLSLTQVEIAQMIGVSRETVTRLLGEFRNKRVIELKGASLFICDKAALESFINP